MQLSDFIFVSGLTGVGKSSTLVALTDTCHKLLPNRRQLTDDIIIPQVQRDLGQAIRPVSDRLERFESTRLYRQKYGGIITALLEYIETNPVAPEETWVFDNVRGLEECRAALETFQDTRFLFLDAPPIVRLKRMLGRNDVFDKTSAARLENTTFTENLMGIQGLDEVFDAYELARLEANADVSDDKLLDAIKIIVKEQENYNAGAAAAFLQTKLDDKRLLYLDTSQLNLNEVIRTVKDWL